MRGLWRTHMRGSWPAQVDAYVWPEADASRRRGLRPTQADAYAWAATDAC